MATTAAWHGIVHDFRDEMHDLATITTAAATRQAYLALWVTFMGVPLLFGLDRFAGIMNASWEGLVATWVDDLLPGSTTAAVMTFGVIELVLFALVAAMPRVGGDLLALWLVLWAINLFTVEGYAWAAMGTLALAACCLAMARMSTSWHEKEDMPT